MEEYNREYEYSNQSRKNSVNISPKFIVGILLFGVSPGILLGLLWWWVLHAKLKQKPSMLYLAIFIYSFVIWLVYLFTSPFSQISKENLGFPYFFLCLIVSVLSASWFCFWFPRQLKMYPEMRNTKGWANNFEYDRTIFEKIKRKKLTQQLKDGELYDNERAPLGILEDKVLIKENGEGYATYFDEIAIVDAYYSERSKHTLATGNTGSGKTVSLLNAVANDFASGRTVCVVDFKKSQDWIYFLSKWAEEYGRPFYHFTAGRRGTYNNPYCDFQASYDPLAKGSIASKADMVLNMRSWDGAAEIYKKKTQTILVSIFYLLDTVNKEETASIIPWERGGLAQFVAALDVENLTQLIAQLEKDLQRKEARGEEVSESDYDKRDQLLSLHETLTNRGSSLKEQIDNLVANCRTLIMSDYGDWLSKGQTPNHIDLTELAVDKEDKKPVILFSFNPLEESDFSKIMGSLIMTDLSRAADFKTKNNLKKPFGLYVDEFQTLDPMMVKDMLEKSRGAGYYITLSLQSLEQIAVSASGNGEAVKQSFLDTINNFIIHAGATQNSAEAYAGILGTRKVITYKSFNKLDSGIMSWNWSNSRDNTVTTALEDGWIVSPEKFQGLQSPTPENDFKSTAYYITKTSSDPDFAEANRATAKKVHVIVREDIVGGIPREFSNQFNTPRSVPLLWEGRIVRKKNTFIDNDFPDEDQFEEIEIPNDYPEYSEDLDSLEPSHETIRVHDDLLEGLGQLGTKTTTPKKQQKKETSFTKMTRK